METLNVFFLAYLHASRSFYSFWIVSLFAWKFMIRQRTIEPTHQQQRGSNDFTSVIITQFNVRYNIKVEIQTKDKRQPLHFYPVRYNKQMEQTQTRRNWSLALPLKLISNLIQSAIKYRMKFLFFARNASEQSWSKKKLVRFFPVAPKMFLFFQCVRVENANSNNFSAACARKTKCICVRFQLSQTHVQCKTTTMNCAHGTQKQICSISLLHRKYGRRAVANVPVCIKCGWLSVVLFFSLSFVRGGSLSSVFFSPIEKSFCSSRFRFFVWFFRTINVWSVSITKQKRENSTKPVQLFHFKADTTRKTPTKELLFIVFSKNPGNLQAKLTKINIGRLFLFCGVESNYGQINQIH